MTNKLWIFPAVFCVLISLTFAEGFSILGFILGVLWFIRILYLKNRTILFATVLIGLSFFGVIQYQQLTNQSRFSGNETTFIVYPKATSIQVNGASIRFDGVLQNTEVEENVVVQYTLKTEAEKKQWVEQPPNTHLLLTGALEAPARASNFHQFNYRTYLQRKNTYWQVKAETIQQAPLEIDSKPSFHPIESIRLSIFQYIDRVFNEKVGGYLKTLFFADNRDFSEEALQQFRELGVLHLFSISGFHITYLANAIRQFLLSLGRTHERTNLLLILVLPMYGVLAGFGVSVFRAVSQNVLLLISKTLNKPMDTLDAWSITMMLALFIQPYSIYHISFQLSYTLSGIFILMSHKRWIQETHPLLYSLLFSLMGGLASLPILTYHFFEVPWITVFSNLFFIPFFTYALFPALWGLFMLSILFNGTHFFIFLNETLSLLLTGVEQFLTLLNATFDFSFVTGRLPGLILCLLFISVVQLLKYIENKKRPPLFALIGLFISLFYYQLSPAGYVLMLDVGQGEAIAIKEPMQQKVTLIDTGGQVQWGEKEAWEERTSPFSIGRDRVVPALKAFGIAEIDRLYVTHADADHMGEMAAIGNEMTIKEVAASRSTLKEPAVLQQLNELSQVPIHIIEPPERVDFPNKDSIILQPLEENQSKNNQSLVLYVRMGEDNWLFTGDIETEAEKQLIREYPNLKANYLKVGHHGSHTSSTPELIKQLQPEVALISAGKNNSFGHPSQEVLERLEAEGIEIYSTAEDGAIMKRYIKWPFINQWQTNLQTVHKN